MFGNDWDEVLKDEMEKPYFQQLMTWLDQEYEEAVVYPPRDLLFQAFRLTPYAEVKAVILGQDPYHGAGQAEGLSFSVMPGVRVPPSLRNIYIELKEDLNIPTPNHGSLVQWGKEGVLLLNTALTVRESKPASHRGKGWEQFTDAVIHALNDRSEPMAFLLWGNHAAEKESFIDQERHLIIRSAHPSPFAARKGFFGSKPFSRTNEFLEQHGERPIDWHIPNIT
ncbi:uracil-DNA glycosylase [Paenibacillus sp. SORGH_AS306]|uniref:uracil-DNA glycosylase n=1 Tax=unclassified Paenibacillus TaxID=185978 RepID=UPI002789BD94|nr:MULTISPECIES: uracil-DNA glycosylase [unclassified Paenibacillus]MDQ1234974.1 uracil-DNA glycosylase [Paenibacillus sp. SORGH_AS_0306]MDR6112023.1 uracil-DNA glycosylase [Paenibacillus sp. SORGH_AS_0338]